MKTISQKENPEVEDGDRDGDVRGEISGCEVPKSIARHGPGFLKLTGEEKSQVRRLHHNLGHPTAERRNVMLHPTLFKEHGIINATAVRKARLDLNLHVRLLSMMILVLMRLLVLTLLCGQIIWVNSFLLLMLWMKVLCFIWEFL